MTKSVRPDGTSGAGRGAVAPAGSARRPLWRRPVFVLVLPLVVLGGAVLATWATDTGPFTKPAFCWGAWQEDSGPSVLGDDYGRVSWVSAAPRRGEQATCVLALTSADDHSMDAADILADGGTQEPSTGYTSVVARVGPPPRSTGDARRTWLTTYLSGSAAPLPEGLPGVAGMDGGMLVLPEECDSGGLPTVVTVRGGGPVGDIGSEVDVADMLLSLANAARGEAGCAEGEPSRITAPVRVSPEGGEQMGGGRAGTCGIQGLRFDGGGRKDAYRAYAGPVGARLQICSLEHTPSTGDPSPAGQFVMTSQPRLLALFDGMAGGAPPDEGWRGKGKIGGGNGLVTADCRGLPTVFSLHLDDRLDKRATPDTRRVFARGVNSVAERLGCRAVAPRT